MIIETNKLLDVNELIIQYKFDGNLVPVVDRVSFFIEPGDIVALVGESGCGKTQIALSLAGLLTKSANVSQQSVNNIKTAMIFQDPLNALNPVLKVGKQILEGIRKKEKRKKEEVVSLLESVGIDEPERRYNQYPHEFSGRIVESAPTDELFSSPKHPYTKALIQVAGLEKENNSFITIDGSVPDPRDYPAGCPFHPRCDVAEDGCKMEYPELTIDNDHCWNCVHR